MSILSIENLTYAHNSKMLYQNATMKINKGEHIVLIGPNGCGKTTLLNLMIEKLHPDKGTITKASSTKIGYLDQHLEVDNNLTVDEYLKTTYQDLFAKEKMIDEIYEAMALDYQEAMLNKALKLQDELDNSNFVSINKKINNLVVGLNIDKNLLTEKLANISSGQKSKVLLAKLLLSDNNLLLLDEPTNFLDIEQVDWLANFLQSYPNAYLIISHDQNFINKVSKVIYEIDNFVFNRYVGGFDDYLELNDIRKKQYLSQYKMQQGEIKKLETYIAKNIARASTAKSAQSRKKKLDKMVVLNKPKEIPVPKFKFKYKQPVLNIIFEGEKLEIGYRKPLTHPLNFIIKADQKWLIKGHNGIGKTTFLKTLTSRIQPLGGKLINHLDKIKIGFFEQNIMEHGEITAVLYLRQLNPDLSENEIRSILASFSIKGELMMKPIKLLSGGEQTKVQLSALSIEPYHVLILDEPTNHLDNVSKTSLLQAINDFPGTVLMTTHDTNVDQTWANNLLDFEKLI